MLSASLGHQMLKKFRTRFKREGVLRYVAAFKPKYSRIGSEYRNKEKAHRYTLRDLDKENGSGRRPWDCYIPGPSKQHLGSESI
jgi:hypothetical protein